jgi:hypothetical protein
VKKSVKRPVGRPPGRKAPRRPVLSARVPEDVYEQVKASAQAAGRTMSEEIIWRARQTYAVNTINILSVPSGHFIRPDGQVLPDPPDEQPGAKLTPSELWAELRAHRYTQLAEFQGAFWLAPGMLPASMTGRDALALMLTSIVKAAIRDGLAPTLEATVKEAVREVLAETKPASKDEGF